MNEKIQLENMKTLLKIVMSLLTKEQLDKVEEIINKLDNQTTNPKSKKLKNYIN